MVFLTSPRPSQDISPQALEGRPLLKTTPVTGAVEALPTAGVGSSRWALPCESYRRTRLLVLCISAGAVACVFCIFLQVGRAPFQGLVSGPKLHGPDVAADDLIQESQLSAWPAPQGYIPPSPPEEWYVTLLMNGNAYLPGVQALAESLLDSNATRPLMVLTTDAPWPELLGLAEILKFQVQWVPYISNPNAAPLPQWTFVLTKINIFRVKSRRVIYLDADTVVMRNIDDLFEGSGFNAVADAGRGQSFNSGVMVLSPSDELFDDLMLKLPLAISQAGLFNDGGDQGFLNWYFRDQWQVSTSLPGRFNTLMCEELAFCEHIAWGAPGNLKDDYDVLNAALKSVLDSGEQRSGNSTAQRFEAETRKFERIAAEGRRKAKLAKAANKSQLPKHDGSCGCHANRKDKRPFSKPGKVSVLHLTPWKPWKEERRTPEAPLADLAWQRYFDASEARCRSRLHVQHV